MIHRKVDLGPYEGQIRSHILKNYIAPGEEKTLVSKSLKFTENPGLKEFLNSNLETFYRQIGKQLQVNDSPIIFGIKPETMINLHIDGFTLDRKHARNFALNIPLMNCDLGVMHWYGGDYTISEDQTPESLKYLKLTWNKPPKIIASAVIDSPTVVQVDIPHSVHNHSEKPRLILSIRFVPDIPDTW